MRPLALVGRILFALIFVSSGFMHFSHATIAFSAKAGVPLANVLVPLAGLLSIVGGLMVLVGFRTRIGALLLIIFLVPVTVMMHPFWAVSDPVMRQMQLANFMKNVAMLGGAVYMCYFGSGPLAVDDWLAHRRPVRRAPERPIAGTPTPA